MKLQRSSSEKRTWKAVNGDFVGREHSVSRSMEIPDGLSPEEVREQDMILLRSCREAVLVPFVAEGMLTPEEFGALLALYDALVESARPEPAAP